MNYRSIKTTITGSRAVDGAGVHLVRVIGNSTVKEFDPFLMLDAFDSENPADYVKGFPWHPHRGIETVTYLISGDIEHGDSLGNKGSILDGGCQWMTAGSGIIHQEMPKASPRMLGLQLWLNLPAKDKMCEPKYRDLTAGKIPVVTEQGVRIAVIAGEYRGTNGSMRADYVQATMLDVALEPGASTIIPVSPGNTVFAYILDGSVNFSPDTRDYVERRRAVLLSDGDGVCLSASESSGARLVLFSGAPLKEPVAWGGPIVMNTREELELAFRELDENTFIKHKGV
jgi:redox-sensitive bicupin YhaK (pirin superfamily)